MARHPFEMNCQIEFLNLTAQKQVFNQNFAFFAVLSGALSVHSDKKQFLCQAGEILLFQPHTPFRLQRVNEQCEVVSLRVHPEFFSGSYPALCTQLLSAPVLLQDTQVKQFLLLAVLSALKKGVGWELICSSYICQLFFQLLQNFPVSEKSIKKYTDRLYQVLQYCHSHYSQKFSIQAMAEQIGLSSSYLSHSFKRETGISVQEYVCRLRMEHACRMILTQEQKSLSEICFASGFSDYRYFNREFQRRYHCTPQQFRQSLRRLGNPYLYTAGFSEHSAQPLSLSRAQKLAEDLLYSSGLAH